MKPLLLLFKVVTVFIFHQTTAAQIITTIAGTIGTPGYSGDGGPALTATFNHPYGLAADNNGNIYIFDQLNAVIRKINAAGIISTFAGTGAAGYSGDGGPATAAQLSNKYSGNPAIDNAGNIYISDAGNFVIRKINSAGIISTIAGNGTFGFSGDNGPARSARILPRDIAVDHNGNIYIADGQSRIRKIGINGIITTIAGSGTIGSAGDGGPALSATIDVSGIAVDPAGTIYFSDVNNNKIRKINTVGIISTIAGTGTQGYSGDGGPAILAALKEPYDVHADARGNIYIADYNHTIRKINTTGIITTVAGNGTAGYSGDGGLATQARLNYPLSVWVDGKGDIFITDFWDNHTVRKISNCPDILTSSVMIHSSATAVCSNTAITFTAVGTHGGNSPVFQWKVNDQPAGNNSATFTSSSLLDGDVVSCVMISSLPCTNAVNSVNTITISILPSPVITLTPEIVIDPGNSIQLSPLVTGNIVSFQWSPAAGLSNSAIANPVASPVVTSAYFLTVRSSEGCESTAKTTVTVYKKLLLPSAFTPNGDGKNDVFRIPPGTTLNEVSFSIFDRAGQVVFHTKDTGQGWDGDYKGALLPPGMYVYQLTGSDPKGNVFLKGTVLLIR